MAKAKPAAGAKKGKTHEKKKAKEKKEKKEKSAKKKGDFIDPDIEKQVKEMLGSDADSDDVREFAANLGLGDNPLEDETLAELGLDVSNSLPLEDEDDLYGSLDDSNPSSNPSDGELGSAEDEPESSESESASPGPGETLAPTDPGSRAEAPSQPSAPASSQPFPPAEEFVEAATRGLKRSGGVDEPFEPCKTLEPKVEPRAESPARGAESPARHGMAESLGPWPALRGTSAELQRQCPGCSMTCEEVPQS